MTAVDQGDRNPTSVTGGNAGGDQIGRCTCPLVQTISLSGNHLKQHNPVPMVLNISYFVCSFIKQPMILLPSRDCSGDSRKGKEEDRLVLAFQYPAF